MHLVKAGHPAIAHHVHGAGAVEEGVVVGQPHEAVDVFPVAEQGAQRLVDVEQIAQPFQQIVADAGAVRAALVFVQGGAPDTEQRHLFLFAALPVVEQAQHGAQGGVAGAVVERLVGGRDGRLHGVNLLNVLSMING